ncbi:MAG: LPS assembly lipoprotein LptE [Campylobacterota bacterium]|nr:LPS assembly lipoprotein LptE [Campylobacterota bacterium]
MRTIVSVLMLVVIFTGCGYKMASHYAQSVIGNKVSTQVYVSLHDPENAVIIKDAVDTAVITRFKSQLCDKSESVTHLAITISDITFKPLKYDTNGYVTAYQTDIFMQILRTTGDISKTYLSRGSYDFSLRANAIISEQARFEAIRNGAQKAIDGFLAQVSSETFTREKK